MIRNAEKKKVRYTMQCIAKKNVFFFAPTHQLLNDCCLPSEKMLTRTTQHLQYFQPR